MVPCIKVATLSTLLIVEDSVIPHAIFAIENNKENSSIHQYIRLDILPESLREAVRKDIWKDTVG